MSDAGPTGDNAELSNKDLVTVLVKNNQAFLNFLTRRLGSLEDAEDVLQDFSIKALSHHNQLRDTDSLVAWLYSILRSSLADHYRKSEQYGKLNQAVARELQSSDNIIGCDHNDDLHDSLCACLHALLPALRIEQAELVRRVDLAEEPRKSVAADLGVSLGTLAVKLHRARQVLRRALLSTCASCVKNGFDDCGCGSGKKLAPDT